jgi:hypothetical protein
MRSLLIYTHHHISAVQGGIPFALLPLIFQHKSPASLSATTCRPLLICHTLGAVSPERR